jgi:uncharacterized protein (TIGR00295 family)
LTGAKERHAKLPSRDECIELLRECGCNERVIAHCKAVSALAVKIAKHCGGDSKLVEIGGLLHDLGRCKAHTIAHAVEGAKIARERKLPEALANIIERHIGAGISKEEAKELGLPEKDYIPLTLEEKIVSHSDNLMSGVERTSINEAVAYLTREGQMQAALRMLALHKELSARCGIDLDEVV